MNYRDELQQDWNFANSFADWKLFVKENLEKFVPYRNSYCLSEVLLDSRSDGHTAQETVVGR